jgi:hypothetical protein
MEIVVELVERVLERRVITDSGPHLDKFSRRTEDVVPVRRNVRQIRIRDGRTGPRENRDDGQDDHKPTHWAPLSLVGDAYHVADRRRKAARVNLSHYPAPRN